MRAVINQRFHLLFPDYSNVKLGKELGVRDTTVFKWQHDMEQVVWEELKYIVETKCVTWKQLIARTVTGFFLVTFLTA